MHFDKYPLDYYYGWIVKKYGAVWEYNKLDPNDLLCIIHDAYIYVKAQPDADKEDRAIKNSIIGKAQWLVIDYLRRKNIYERGYKKGVTPLKKKKSLFVSLYGVDLSIIDKYSKEKDYKKYEALQIAIKQLSPRDQEFVRLHFFGNMQLKEIAKVLNLTTGRCCQLKEEILIKLKKVYPKSEAFLKSYGIR